MWANISEYRVGNSHPVWSKVPVLVDAFKKHPQAKWLWWLDIDAIIMTPTIDLASHVLSNQALLSKLRKGEAYHLRGEGKDGVFHTPENPDPNQINLVITGDHNGINAGSFFLRRSDWTDVFLDLWVDPYYVERDWPGKEQDAIIHMIQYHKFISDHVGIVPQRTMNAYSEGNEQMRWHPKDLIIHFAGCWYYPLHMSLIVGSRMLVRSDGGNSGRNGKWFLGMKGKRIKSRRMLNTNNISRGQNI
jgi:hypothetical protein